MRADQIADIERQVELDLELWRHGKLEFATLIDEIIRGHDKTRARNLREHAALAAGTQ